jgi:predicted amidohydrolase YtcJ
MKLAGILIAAFLLSTVLLADDKADIIYYNGKVITVWDAKPVVEAVAIRGNHFLKVGSNKEALETAGPSTKKYDLKGRCMLPGIIEGHTHPVSAALSEQDGPVPVMNSIPEIQAYIKKRAAALSPDQIIFVPKIYPSRLKERRYPTRYEIDEAAPGRLAMCDNGYASVLNSALLAKAGITRDTAQPPNGKIIKDERGEPTGLILGAPQLLGRFRRSRPRTHADLVWAIKAMQKAYNRVGITSTIDRAQGPDGLRAYQEVHEKGEMTVRTTVTYRISAKGTPQQVADEVRRIPFVTGWGDDWLRVGAIKTIVDGGILIGTAYLRAPWGMNTQIYGYVDPDYRGVLEVPKENLIEMAKVANQLGWQMTAHTTGGGAVDLLLDAYEAADREKSIRGRRFTVTHGNFPDARAIERAKKLGVVFDSQIAWLYCDGPALKNVFGPARMKNFLPLRSLIDAGIVVVGGSDHMIRFDPRNAINPYHPFFAMWMAITRKTVDGTVLNPEQRITREEALRMWTINGAWDSFDEKVKGSIEPGKLADMVVIPKDYLTCPVDEIKGIEPLLTMVDGKVVYGDPASLR